MAAEDVPFWFGPYCLSLFRFSGFHPCAICSVHSPPTTPIYPLTSCHARPFPLFWAHLPLSCLVPPPCLCPPPQLYLSLPVIALHSSPLHIDQHNLPAAANALQCPVKMSLLDSQSQELCCLSAAAPQQLPLSSRGPCS